MPRAGGTRRSRARRDPSPRASRCSYIENGRQCVRNGTGNPPICRAHRIVLEHEYEQNEAASGLGRVISDFLGGRRINADDAIRGIAELLGAMGTGGVGAPGQRRAAHAPGGAPWPFPFGPPPGFDPYAPHGHQRRVPPHAPPVDPEHAQRQRALLMARQELGFQPREPLTRDLVERRRKDLARKHHPDLGGSVERMQTINQAADLLLEQPDLG